MASYQKNASRRVVIIGGGVSGLSIAVRLSQSGLPVMLLEASDLGLAASIKNQGWLYSGAWFAPRQRNLARFCYQSLQDTIRFCPECLEPNVGTMIYIVSSRRTNLSKWTDAWTEAGIPYDHVPISLAAEKTGLSPSKIGRAFRLPDRAFRPAILLERLTAQAEYQGVEIRTRSPISALLREGDRVRAVVTARGEEFEAGVIILAANAGGSELWPSPLPAAETQTVPQSEFTRVGVKTHCLTIRPQLATTPYCVIDLDGLNHIPHAPTSVIGSCRWFPIRDCTNQKTVRSEVNHLRELIATLYPSFQVEKYEVVDWAGTTVQAMHVDQVEPGLVPMPTVIDHELDPPFASNVLSVFPGRASLWPQLAEVTRFAALAKLGERVSSISKPPWALDNPSRNSTSETVKPQTAPVVLKSP
jgi:glycine/D-amino acid oxidase-like deaminating enzyme